MAYSRRSLVAIGLVEVFTLLFLIYLTISGRWINWTYRECDVQHPRSAQLKRLGFELGCSCSMSFVVPPLVGLAIQISLHCGFVLCFFTGARHERRQAFFLLLLSSASLGICSICMLNPGVQSAYALPDRDHQEFGVEDLSLPAANRPHPFGQLVAGRTSRLPSKEANDLMYWNGGRPSHSGELFSQGLEHIAMSCRIMLNPSHAFEWKALLSLVLVMSGATAALATFVFSL